MFRWLVVLVVSLTLALGFNPCCCGLRIAKNVARTGKAFHQNTTSDFSQNSQGECCTSDDSHRPSCCGQASGTSAFVQTGQNHAISSEITKCDCCSNSRSCCCSTVPRAISLPNPSNGDYKWILKHSSPSTRISADDTLHIQKTGFLLSFEHVAGLGTRPNLSMIQRWNC